MAVVPNPQAAGWYRSVVPLVPVPLKNEHDCYDPGRIFVGFLVY